MKISNAVAVGFTFVFCAGIVLPCVPPIHHPIVSGRNPGQIGSDGIESFTGGLNYYVHGDNVKVMADYVHTCSDFRQAHPQFGDDQFDELLLLLQVLF